jgi:cellulose synthase/poly-beta-1,6-N-acetylglucosamine synthase-like glycosyltransferase
MIAIVTLILSAYLAVLTLGDFYLLFAHLRRGQRSVALERSDTERAAVAAGQLPRVCVQLPVHNEPAAVAQAIDALCDLDWPTDRLELLVLDDSTDETSRIGAEKIDDWRKRGRTVGLLRRADRSGFKAGALQAALQATDAEYIAIFDVDYRPERSFLHKAMNVLMADPRLAFVQARLDFRNRDQNWLTRAQGMELDTHLAYEQAARNWAGVPSIFNGTCGIWRRGAIEEAGGWSSRSLGEDQDLSFRAFAQGWRSRYLLTVSVGGELPHRLADLIVQRRRWGMASTQNLRVLPWRLLRHLDWHQAAAFLLIFQFNTMASLLIGVIAMATLATSIFEPQFLGLSATALLCVVLLVVGSKTAGSALARRILGRGLGIRYWTDVMLMWVMHAILLPVSGKAFLRALVGKDDVFVRTPKVGV